MRTITVEPGSDIARLLSEADEEPILIVQNGSHYRLSREYEPSVDDETMRLLEALRNSAGIWKHVDVERLKGDLREQRGQDSQGRPGW